MAFSHRENVGSWYLKVSLGTEDYYYTSCVCTLSPQAGSRDFGENHKYHIIDTTSYQGETEPMGLRENPRELRKTPEDNRYCRNLKEGTCSPDSSITLMQGIMHTNSRENYDYNPSPGIVYLNRTYPPPPIPGL